MDKFDNQQIIEKSEQMAKAGSGNRLWYVMRDLKRTNASTPAWKMLSEIGFEVFTPIQWKLNIKGGKRIKREVAVIPDLLFVYSDRNSLDAIVRKTPTLQYRFLKNQYLKPMTVREIEMGRFINAIKNSEKVNYYSPEEVSSILKGKTVRIIGGPMNGYEGRLLTTKGSKVKRLLVEIPNLLSAGIEVQPEYIEVINNCEPEKKAEEDYKNENKNY